MPRAGQRVSTGRRNQRQVRPTRESSRPSTEARKHDSRDELRYYRDTPLAVLDAHGDRRGTGGRQRCDVDDSIPPYPFWPLIFVAAIPFLLAQSYVLPGRWSSLAPAITVGGWIGFYFARIFGLGGGGAWYMRSLPLLISVLVFLTEHGTRRLNERTGYRWFILQGVTGWIGFEMIPRPRPAYHHGQLCTRPGRAGSHPAQMAT